LGASIAPNRIAKALTGQVNKPVNAKADKPKIMNWLTLMDIHGS
jgi:hypothetical protein